MMVHHKMKVIFSFMFLISRALLFDQNDYNMVFERAEFAASSNEHYLTNVKMVTFKYNRTQPAVNASFTVKVDAGYDVNGVVQANTFLSNEYRTFPLHYMFDLCDAISKNDYGLGHIADHGNFTGCPVKKGRYYFYNWKPDTRRFPPSIPNGNYMFEVQILYKSEEAGVAKLYVTITRPLGRRH